MRKRNSATTNGKKDAPILGATAEGGDENALQAKNYKLAKELSDVRVRQREESKNVTRLTMENMNLASRCREAITQAATLKKELIAQKRKTAEAVSQTHQLLSELKKMKNNSPERKTPSIVTTEATTVILDEEASKSPESISTKSTTHHHHVMIVDESDEDEEPKHHDPTTPNGLVSSDDYEPPGQPSPPRPDAPAASEEDEANDTVADTIPETQPPSFPSTASPQVPRRFASKDSYDEEYPSDLSSCQSTKETTSLLSSIDAFEASFKTSFPKSFTPKEGDEPNVAYDPFDTNSPQKRSNNVSDPPGDHTAPLSPSRIDRSPRDTVPKKVGSSDSDKRLSRTIRTIETDKSDTSEPTQHNMVGERLADRFQASIDAANKRISKSEEVVVTSPHTKTTTESMVSRLKKNLTSSQGSPPDENYVLSKAIRSSTKSLSPPSLEDPQDTFHLRPPSSTVAVEPERSPTVEDDDDPVDPLDKYQVALRTQQKRTVSAPRGFSPEQQHTFATAKAHYERTASRKQSSNDGEIPMQSSIPQKARVTRSWQRPKALLLAGDDDDDESGTFRQRRNVNLSKVAARRADFGGGASPIVVSSPKQVGR